MKLDLKYINAYPDRHGKTRYYFRRKNVRISLPGSPDTAEFMAAYNAALESTKRAPASETMTEGTFKHLCHEYEQSGTFKDLADTTKREMRYVMAKLVQRHGANRIEKIERRHIRKMRDELKEKPGAANKMLRVLKVLLSFAVEEEYIERNPASRVKLMKLGEHRAWTTEELRIFEGVWPLGTVERLGYALALFTGQRRADVSALKWTDIAGDAFKLKQGKTGTVLVIPLHPELKKVLAAVHPRSETILAKNGRALNPIYFGHLMAEAIDAAGLPKECVLHGLRKSAAVALIDAGCTPHQAMAITGHKTAQMLELYAKRRDQEKLGRAAMKKWKAKR